MIKNNLKIAWRSLIKDRQFTLLNLLGLSTGLACTLLIYLWVSDETHIDKFNKNDSRLYQVLKTDANGDGTVTTRETTQGLLAETMAREIPEIEYAVSVRKENQMGVLSVGGKHIKAKSEFVDKDFFNVFSYRLIQGTAMPADKNGVLLSDKFALKVFNTTGNIIGKTISWDFGEEFSGLYTVAGVFESPPANASDQPDILFTYKLFAEKEAGSMGDISFWGSNMSETYIVLKEGTNIDAFNKKIKEDKTI